MKVILFLIVILISSFNYLQAQIYPSDSIKFVRYIEDTDNKVNIPLTTLYYLHNTRLKDNWFGWIMEKDLQSDSTKDMLLIDMSTNDVPTGVWSEYTPGAFQLAFEIDKGTHKILLDSINNKICLINSYATRGVNKPTNKVSGGLNIISCNTGEIKIDGIIRVESKNPTTKHEIVFNNAQVPNTDYKGFVGISEKHREEERKQELRERELANRIAMAEDNFYDSLFNIKLYPENKLKANFRNNKFDFILDRSFILTGADISSVPSSDLMDILGGYIFYPVKGSFIVFHLHYLFEGEKNIIDDEINYSLLFAIPVLEIKEYDINESKDTKAKLAYVHYGPDGYIIESKTVSGSISIIKIEKQTVWAKIDVEFESTDDEIFTLTGNIQLPILEKEIFNKISGEIDKIKKELQNH